LNFGLELKIRQNISDPSRLSFDSFLRKRKLSISIIWHPSFAYRESANRMYAFYA